MYQIETAVPHSLLFPSLWLYTISSFSHLLFLIFPSYFISSLNRIFVSLISFGPPYDVSGPCRYLYPSKYLSVSVWMSAYFYMPVFFYRNWNKATTLTKISTNLIFFLLIHHCFCEASQIMCHIYTIIFYLFDLLCLRSIFLNIWAHREGIILGVEICKNTSK